MTTLLTLTSEPYVQAALLAASLWLVGLYLAARISRGEVTEVHSRVRDLEAQRPPLAVFLLVHGTFGWFAGWTREGSLMRARLAAAYDEQVIFRCCPWPGLNSFGARRVGSERLLREIRASKTRWPDARHFVIAHSHGGNVAIAATKRLTNIEQMDGVVCMATPFLVPTIFRMPTLSKNARQLIEFFAAIFPLVFLLISASSFLPDSVMSPLKAVWDQYLQPTAADFGQWTMRDVWRLVLLAVVLGAVVLILVTTRRAARRVQGAILESLSPTTLSPEQLLILRQPGDEAGAFIGAAHLISWIAGLLAQLITAIVVPLDRTWRLARRTAFGRQWRVYGLLATSAIAGATAFPLSVGIWYERPLAGIISVPFVLVGLLNITGFLLTPFLILLLASYLAVLLPMVLSVGPEMVFAGLKVRVTAEATPVGEWTVHTRTISGELRRERPLIGALLHSALYEDPETLDFICALSRKRSLATDACTASRERM